MDKPKKVDNSETTPNNIRIYWERKLTNQREEGIMRQMVLEKQPGSQRIISDLHFIL